MRSTMFKRVALVLLAVITVVVFSASDVLISTEGESVAGNVTESGSSRAQTVDPVAFQENWGDVDQNGKRDSTDARLVLQFAVGKIKETALLVDAADVDGDTVVNSTDARLILQYAVKKTWTFPVTERVYTYAAEKGLTDAASEEAWLKSLQINVSETNIIGAYIDVEEHLILKLSDNSIVDAGYVGGGSGDNTTTTTTPTTTTSSTGSSTTPTTPTVPSGPTYHTVVFKDHDGTVLKTEQVESGKSATSPQYPHRVGYVFTGWDKGFTKVSGELTITAQYQKVNDPTLMITDVLAAAGTTVEVPVVVCNNPGVAGARIFVEYNEQLTLVKAEKGTAFENLDYTEPASLATPCPFNWDSLDAVSAKDGTVILLTFEVPDAAMSGATYDVDISYRTGDVYDVDLNDVDFELIGGTITVW